MASEDTTSIRLEIGERCLEPICCKWIGILENVQCYFCNGFYGPIFGDPTCETCHAFLYPNAPIRNGRLFSYNHTNDSESDSGNDEPAVLADNSQDCGANTAIVEESYVNDSPLIQLESLSRNIERLSSITFNYQQFNMADFPSEVLMHMFQFLDEISLWCIGQVCKRWRDILFMCVKPQKWESYSLRRWPLFPYCRYKEHLSQDWYELYTKLMKSCCCLKCVKQMAATKLPTVWQENSWRRHRLRTEIKTMLNDPLDGINAIPLDDCCCHWQATIEGPKGSPYEGGMFFLYLQVPPTYPLDPPHVRFITKIFHPNISRHGDLGIDCILHNWSVALTISKLLISIQSLLSDPYCDICMEPAIAEMYSNNRICFETEARYYTLMYAMHDIAL